MSGNMVTRTRALTGTAMALIRVQAKNTANQSVSFTIQIAAVSPGQIPCRSIPAAIERATAGRCQIHRHHI
jgi:hypothetical protein